MPHLVDVVERDLALTDAVLGLAGEGGVAGVTFRDVARRAGLTMAEVRYARPTRDRLLHLAVARAAGRRARHRRDVHLRTSDPVVRLVDCWLPAYDGEVEREGGWQAFRRAVPILLPGTVALLAEDDAELLDLCAATTGSITEATLLAATAEGLAAAVVRGSLDPPTARTLLTTATRAPVEPSNPRAVEHPRVVEQVPPGTASRPPPLTTPGTPRPARGSPAAAAGTSRDPTARRSR